MIGCLEVTHELIFTVPSAIQIGSISSIQLRFNIKKQQQNSHKPMNGMCSDDRGKWDPTCSRNTEKATKTAIPNDIFSPLCSGMRNTRSPSKLIAAAGKMTFMM